MADKNSYLIEDLPAIFGKHADEADWNHQQSIKNHREAFPDSELPEWMSYEFNISRALAVMAAEIDRLKTICN